MFRSSITTTTTTKTALVSMRLTSVVAPFRQTAAQRSFSSQASAATQKKNQSPPPRSPPPPPRSPPTPSSLPLSHSRKQLPLICTDDAWRKELTLGILEAPIGSLFAYKSHSRSIRSNNNKDEEELHHHHHRELAWREADPVCQKVEFLLRGHAATIPGSLWQRKLSSSETTHASALSSSSNINSDDASSASSNLAVMQSLVDRLWQEGHAYMKVRADKMQEEQLLFGGDYDKDDVSVDLLLQSASIPSSSSSSSPPPLLTVRGGGGGNVALPLQLGRDKLKNANDQPNFLEGTVDEIILQGLGAAADNGPKDNEEFQDYIEMEDLQDMMMDDDESGDVDVPFMNDFAMPGPTVQMYDTLLDAMACSQERLLLPENESFYGLPTHARYLMDCITSRHDLDYTLHTETMTTRNNKKGGQQRSDGHYTLNPYTTPTILSFNAPIRLAANLGRTGYEFLDKNKDLRDAALMLAFLAYNHAAINNSDIVQCNSATYTYLLQVVARYFKNASPLEGNRNKGNIAISLWDSAVQDGLINDGVLQAFLETQTPSNGPAYETWMMQQQECGNLRNVGTAKDLPHKWRHYSKVRRHDEQNDIY